MLIFSGMLFGVSVLILLLLLLYFRDVDYRVADREACTICALPFASAACSTAYTLIH